jgi:hypothetical protein
MFTRVRAASALVALAMVLVPVAACGGDGSGPSAGSPPPSAEPSTSAADTATTSPPAQPSSPAQPSVTAGQAGRVVSSRLAYQWNWPNDAARPGVVRHHQDVPPVPALVAIGVGDHPSDPGERPFNRMSFTFDTGFPGYRFTFADRLYGDATGTPIALAGRGVLVVRFSVAQAHSADGTRSTVTSKPPTNLGLRRMVSYAQAGDYEGVLTYGIGITWPNPHSNPQIQVRAYEVERITAQGQHRFVVAIDVDSR